MGCRKHETDESKFISRLDVVPLVTPISLMQLAILMPTVLKKISKSIVVQARGYLWENYKPLIENGVAYIVSEKCERCGNVSLAPGQRRLKAAKTDYGYVYLDAGICKDCINASVYVDSFLDGEALSEKDAKDMFYSYATDYERQWRITIAAAPNLLLSNAAWQHVCNFFGGCAHCGGHISAKHMFFPASLNGTYSPWNVIPLCTACKKARATIGKRKDGSLQNAPYRFRAFSNRGAFQKTKTIRLFLLTQMDFYGIYSENLMEYRKRFRETKLLPHSLLSVGTQEITQNLVKLSKNNPDEPVHKLIDAVNKLLELGVSTHSIATATAADTVDDLNNLVLATRVHLYRKANENDVT